MLFKEHVTPLVLFLDGLTCPRAAAGRAPPAMAGDRRKMPPASVGDHLRLQRARSRLHSGDAQTLSRRHVPSALAAPASLPCRGNPPVRGRTHNSDLRPSCTRRAHTTNRDQSCTLSWWKHTQA